MVLLWYSQVRRQSVTTTMRCLQLILKSGSMIRSLIPNIIESVDSISRDERDVPLTQYITNA